jgi:Tol biopolymer transport system component
MKRAMAVLVPVLLVSFLASPIAGADNAARTLPANGRILFTHCDDTSGCQIYTANPDGSVIDQVTHAAGEAVQGDWSPDGERITYVSFTSGDTAIWIINADGTHPKQLTPNDPDSDNFWPRFTPDGVWILFTNCFTADCDGGISMIKTDGTAMQPVTPNSHDSYNLADMGPDGRLAYMRWHVDSVKMAIYVSAGNGSHEHRVSPPRLQGWYPDWSPRGGRIAFTSEVFWDRPAPSLYTVRPNGSGLEALTHPPFPHSDVHPAYSPNGRRVIFESDRRYDDFCCSDLFVVPASGGTPQRVHLPFDAYEPRWGTAPIVPTPGVAARQLPVASGSPCAFIRELAVFGDCSLRHRS